MRNGRLREVITVREKKVTNHASTNEEIVTWADHCQAFVSHQNMTAREFVKDGQRFSRNYVKFTGHFFDLMTVREAMRIDFNDQTYDIVAVRPDHQYKKDVEIDAVLVL